jgi:signal transduction histidine kinase
MPATPHRPRAGLLAGMKIRKKLIVLHTCFSLGLAAILLVALRPAVTRVIEQAETSEARLLLRAALSHPAANSADPRWSTAVLDHLADTVDIRFGQPADLGIDPATAINAAADPGAAISVPLRAGRVSAVIYVPAAADAPPTYAIASVQIPEARRAVLLLYGLMTLALLAAYALVALALEVLVLPQNVYRPIRRILAADAAVQQSRGGGNGGGGGGGGGGRGDEELIPEAAIPADELGEIMRSRNETIQALRRHERALAQALAQLEEVATDLKRKNHLLEAARRNLADADRLASLGMMSAGLAHELNTPLTVLKGLVEKLNTDPAQGLPPAEAALMLRVVGRLERLGESLLDFARVRPPSARPAQLRPLIDEAATLVRLDRHTTDIDVINNVADALIVECDADRIVQVLVNLLRNAADAIRAVPGTVPSRSVSDRAPRPSPSSDPSSPPDRTTALALSPGPSSSSRGRITIDAETSTKDSHDWVSLTITDTGPGIDPDLLSTVFEPFVSTRLDSRGTGLGLAVAEGIVREHGGLILARNRPARAGGGAVFEIMLPMKAAGTITQGPTSARR